MKVYLYNSLTNSKEEFIPLRQKEVGIYVCGVTVYDRSHLGHARGALFFDVMKNFFSAIGYKVTLVKNYTDIDDKIITRAHERNISVQQLTTEEIAHYDQMMKFLSVAEADIAPKATEHIDEMIALIETLIEKNYAYVVEGDVFFAIEKFSEYGKLSNRQVNELLAGVRLEVNEKKRHALDFVLWKSAKCNEPSWKSPWGNGRPGWHIECSAMAQKYLGKSFDIHCGGRDLIFPHHENEIAQSESCFESMMARYWMHNGMVVKDGSKMSKSLQNIITVEEALKKYHPEVIRFFLLNTHYRQDINYTDRGLQKAAEGLDRIYMSLFNYYNRYQHIPQPATFLEGSTDKFMKIMADDLNIPCAFGAIFDEVRVLNTTLKEQEKSENIVKNILQYGNILGILQEEPCEWFHKTRILSQKVQITTTEVERYLQQRNVARSERDFEKADSIRTILLEHNIEVKDKNETTTWYFKA